MKSLKALFVLALGIAFLAAPAYAETQNVKVSGSIDAYAFYRDDWDLAKNDQGSRPLQGPAGTAATASALGTNVNKSDADEYFMSITQIEVSADLTDNVSTVVNLVNQRDWNADEFHNDNATGANTAHEFEVALDLAYVQMKEIFYSPLTLTVGRQDIWFGRGFIVGNNSRAWDPTSAIEANEYSATTAFDALRATLDFNPWTIDLLYSKILEGSHGPEDDLDLWGTNVNYKFAEYNAVAEGYFWGEVDRNTLARANATTNGDTRTNTTYTIGGRVQFDPISQITLGGELAYQLGDYQQAVGSPSRDRDAWGANLFGTYRFDNTWKPEVTLEYVHFSGESLTGSVPDDYSAWNGLYRGKFWTAYADFREFVYSTTEGSDQSGATNQNLIQVKGSIKPMDDLMLEGFLSWLWTDEDVTGRNDQLGWEVDFQATYDYTEDVSFGFLAGWFIPGDFFNSPNDETATDLVSSVKVTF